MRKILLLLVLAFAMTSVPAFASVQNIKVGGDVDNWFVSRSNFDLGVPGRQFKQNLFITQTRLRVDADLTDNVAATIALINERAWDAESTANSDIDLNLAYVELREMLYSPLTVIVGRQNFAYGNSFVVDSAGTNNTVSAGGLAGVAEDLTKRTALDAIRMVFDYNPLTVDFVYAKADANSLTGINPQDDDVDLFGTNVNYQLGDDFQTVVEGYFWAKNDQSVKSTGSGQRSDTIYMPGGRISLNLTKSLNFQGEAAYQLGTKNIVGVGDTDRKAFGLQGIANFMIPVEQWNPVMTLVYTFVSGDSSPEKSDDKYTGWDPFFENQATGKIYNALFDLTNVHIAVAKFQFNPMEDVTAALEWTGMWLDKVIDDGTNTGNCSTGSAGGCADIRQPDGTTLTGATWNSNSKLGDEFDVSLMYDYTEDVQFGLAYGYFLPGGAFDSNNDKSASQVLMNGLVAF